MRYFIVLLFSTFLFFACNSQAVKQSTEAKVHSEGEMKAEIESDEKHVIEKLPKGEIPKIEKSEDEWKSELTSSEYRILREKGTERPGTGDLLKNKNNGVYICAACQLPLFSSDTKFESGTGWPSFYDKIDTRTVSSVEDYSLGMKRVEVVCSRCDGHLGHVFEDGPKPTGLRYCINAVSLDFVESNNP